MELPVDSPKPFRLLNLPSLAHDVIFSKMSTEELYYLSKCSTRSRYAVKMFTRRQTYDFNITAMETYCCLDVSNRLDRKTFYRLLIPMGFRELFFDLSFITRSEDFWATTKEEIAFFFDVFTRNVNRLHVYDITNVTKMTELLKENMVLPVDWVRYDVREMDDEVYKLVLKEFKDAKTLEIGASPSAEFRYDDMEPFTGQYVIMKNADWLTVDHLTRCFTNVERVRLWTDSQRCLNVLVFNQSLNAWRKESSVGELDLECDCTNFDLQSIFKNLPTTEVKRVKVGNWKKVFKDGECFLIRQQASGVEALVYFNIKSPLNRSICFTTNFRLLRDDESD